MDINQKINNRLMSVTNTKEKEMFWKIHATESGNTECINTSQICRVMWDSDGAIILEMSNGKSIKVTADYEIDDLFCILDRHDTK